MVAHVDSIAYTTEIHRVKYLLVKLKHRLLWGALQQRSRFHTKYTILELTVRTILKLNTLGTERSLILFCFAGNLDNTFPNPALKKRDSPSHSSNGNSSGSEMSEDKVMEAEEYWPASMLSDWSMERAGRGKRTLDTLACELR